MQIVHWELIEIAEIVSRWGLDLALQSGNELFEEAIKSGYANMVAEPFKFNFKHSREVFDLLRFRSLLETSIHQTMALCKGEKIGITFSGGIDSTMIAWLMKTLYPDEDIVAYHSYFNDPVVDELKYAKEAAKFIGIPLVVVDTSRDKQLTHIEEVTRLCSTMTVGIIHMSILAKAMANDGVQHVMWGLGPGEFIGGMAIDNRWYSNNIRSKLRLYPFANTKIKWDRYVALLFGTDKAYLINKLFKTPSKRYVKGADYTIDWVYNRVKERDLWSNLKKFDAFILVGKTKAKIDCVRAYGMETYFPFIQKEFTNYCLGLSPDAVYNKQPLRDWLLEGGFSETIANRGANFKFGGDHKAGLSPSDSFYDYDYVKQIVPENYKTDILYKEYFTEFTKKNMLKWMKSGDRRAIQIGLFLRMLEHRL